MVILYERYNLRYDLFLLIQRSFCGQRTYKYNKTEQTVPDWIKQEYVTLVDIYHVHFISRQYRYVVHYFIFFIYLF